VNQIEIVIGQKNGAEILLGLGFALASKTLTDLFGDLEREFDEFPSGLT